MTHGHAPMATRSPGCPQGTQRFVKCADTTQTMVVTQDLITFRMEAGCPCQEVGRWGTWGQPLGVPCGSQDVGGQAEG